MEHSPDNHLPHGSTNNTEASWSLNLAELQQIQFGPQWVRPSQARTKPRPKARPVFKPRPQRQHTERKFISRQRPSDRFTINFYPEDLPFQALTKAIRQSLKTYELFEIAKLILEKPERFIVAIQLEAKPDSTKPAHLCCCLIDHMPFLSEDAVLQYVVQNHLEQFFTQETVQVPAPKGHFPFIHRCGLTNKLIAPPNYHKYQRLLQAHYIEHARNMHYDCFLERLIPDKTPQAQQEWLESMQSVTRYTPITTGDTPAESFDTIEGVKQYLLTEHKDRIFRWLDTARIPGHLIDKMPEGELKNTILYDLEDQRRFPLITANNLRGRLRHLHLHLYKKGSSSISYITAVKRKFRDEHTRFADSIQNLIHYLDNHPMTPINELATHYLGLTTPIDTEEAQHNQAFKQLMADLRWLISEGYVIEYSNGKLTSVPIMPTATPKSRMGKPSPEPTHSSDTEAKESSEDPGSA